MRKFQFRLKTLLKLRSLEEKQAKIKLAEATNLLLNEQRILKRYEERLDESFESFRQEQQKISTVETLKVFQTYFDKMKEDISVQRQKVTTAEQGRTECLHSLEKAMQSRKLVEKIYEKRLNEYNLEALREEQKLLDEIGGHMYSLQQMKKGV